jgi:hypothetical protein
MTCGAPASLNVERQRAFEDLLAAERAVRAQSEQSLRETRQLLLELAVRFDGARLEAMRRQDPGTPASWSPADWRRFFASVAVISGWERPKSEPQDRPQAQAQTEALQARVEALTRQLEQALQVKAPAQELPPEAPVTAVQTVLPEGAAPCLASLTDDLKGVLPGLPRAVPAAFSRIITGGGRRGGDRTRAIQRYFAILYLIGRWRLGARMEAETILAAVLGVSPGSGSLRRVFEDLAACGLLDCELFKLNAPVTGLMLCRLSQSGRGLYQALFGHPAQENEWERLIRLHEGERFKEHTLAVMVFAVHARKRGWALQVLPEAPGSPAVPDALVCRGDERYYVEVELQSKERAAKWRNLAALNGGRTALCAATPGKRTRLVGDCKLDKLPGLATDLESLVRNKYASVGEMTPLWLEIW